LPDVNAEHLAKPVRLASGGTYDRNGDDADSRLRAISPQSRDT